jgi:hypothetical protein
MNAVKSRCAQGHSHPSKGESLRCDNLHLQQAGKLIEDLVTNPTITIIQGFKYKADWTYLENKKMVTEDFKGMVTQRFRDIKKLWPHHGIGVLRVSRLKGLRFYTEKDIQGKE